MLKDSKAVNIRPHHTHITNYFKLIYSIIYVCFLVKAHTVFVFYIHICFYKIEIFSSHYKTRGVHGIYILVLFYTCCHLQASKGGRSAKRARCRARGAQRPQPPCCMAAGFSPKRNNFTISECKLDLTQKSNMKFIVIPT